MRNQIGKIAGPLLFSAAFLVALARAEDQPEASFQVLARQRLNGVAVATDNNFKPYNMMRNVTAKEGMHLELFRIQGTATWPGESGNTLYTDLELTYPAGEKELKCAGCAYRDATGVFEKDNAFQLVVRRPYEKGVKSGTLTTDFVFFVPDQPEKLTLKVVESKSEKVHELKLPECAPTVAAPPMLKVGTQITGSEYKTSLTTKDNISYSPKVEADYEWTLTSGVFLLVNTKVILDPGMPEDIKAVVLHPEDFSLKRPDGRLIRAAGLVSFNSLHGGSYPCNIHRNNDGTWPDRSDSTFLFVVPDKLEKFEVVYLPR